MLIAELGLKPESREAWYRIGIRDTDHLRRPAVDLLALMGITGSVLYEAVRLHEHHYGLPAYAGASRIMAATTDDLEMLRLRVVEGASLAEIAETFALSPETVRKKLRSCFGLSGQPPAALERRKRHQHMTENDRLSDGLPCPPSAHHPADGDGCVEDGREAEQAVR